jgi:hypothetical protein
MQTKVKTFRGSLVEVESQINKWVEAAQARIINTSISTDYKSSAGLGGRETVFALVVFTAALGPSS